MTLITSLNALPSNIITLGVRALTQEFRGDKIQSITLLTGTWGRCTLLSGQCRHRGFKPAGLVDHGKGALNTVELRSPPFGSGTASKVSVRKYSSSEPWETLAPDPASFTTL